MTLQVDPYEPILDPTDDLPVVIGIALDHGHRRRLLTALDGSGVLLFAPDLAAARSLLGRSTKADPLLAAPPDDPPEPVVRAGELEVDRVRHRARWRDTALPLNQRERELLACLASGPAQVWTYQRLYQAAWPGRYLDPGPVHAAVKRLRRKLKAAAVPVAVAAVRGVGYELAQE